MTDLVKTLEDLSQLDRTGSVTSVQQRLSAIADKNGWGSQYRKGIEAEVWVREAFTRLGYEWEHSTEYEDRKEDIDLWLLMDGERLGVSIKRQDAGLKYNNIYFETEAQLKNGKWIPSWFHYGKAELYAIVQGSTLRLYRKSDIQAYVEANGWLRVRSLSSAVKATQGGSYAFINARCGFLTPEDVKPIKTITIVRSLPVEQVA